MGKQVDGCTRLIWCPAATMESPTSQKRDVGIAPDDSRLLLFCDAGFVLCVSGLDLHSEDSKFDEDTCQQKENHGGFNEGR